MIFLFSVQAVTIPEVHKPTHKPVTPCAQAATKVANERLSGRAAGRPRDGEVASVLLEKLERLVHILNIIVVLIKRGQCNSTRKSFHGLNSHLTGR